MESIWTVVLAGIGAFIASFAAKFVDRMFLRGQSTETQRDSDLQDIIQSTLKITDLSEKYWLASAEHLGVEDQRLASHLIASQHNIAALLSGLLSDSAKWDCDVEFHRLMTSATGGDFGDPARAAEPGRLTEILTNAHALIHAAKSGRRRLSRSLMS